MDKKNIVSVEIGGRLFRFSSDERAEYIRMLAKQVVEQLRKLLNEIPHIRYDDAAVLTAINYCSDLKKIELIGNTNEIDELKKKLEESQKEAAQLKAELAKLKQESQVTAQKLRLDVAVLERTLSTQREEYENALAKVKTQLAERERGILDMIDAGSL